MNNKQNSISLFTASFKQGFTCPNVPLVTVYNGDKELIFLLDSGSEYNVIDEQSLPSLSYTPVQDETLPNTLSGVGGVTKASACSLSFKCDGKEYTEIFLINDLSDPLKMLKQETGVIMHGILGSKFMMEKGVVLDYRNLMAYSKS